jgi:hypothetical protein
MSLRDNGIRIYEDKKLDSITFSEFKRIKIVNKNIASIHKTIILQAIKDINKKYKRQLTKEEKSIFISKLEKKIKRKLNTEDFEIIKERLINDD